MQYDAISFDIFDTLIFRYLNQPEDLFMLVGGSFKIFDFFGIRKRAEKEVREIKKALYHNNEVTLDEIYERVSYYTGLDAKIGSNREFEIECDMCFANPYMLEVFQILKSAGKRIFATSNMYIPREKMKTLLSKCGFEGFEDIFISCDYHCGKGNGALFEILLDKVGRETRLVHVGDNLNADIKGAEKAGIAHRYYAACRALGDPHRSPGMSPLIGSAYQGIVNSTLHNGTHSFSPLWEYGFVYGGLLAYGYVNWIHQKAQQDGVTKILFLSRDGFLLKQIYDMLFHDIESEYVFWSRIAALRNVCAGERYIFLQRIFEEQCDQGKKIIDCLSLAGLNEIASLLRDNGLDPELPLLSENKIILFNILIENWNLVIEYLSPQQAATQKYLNNIIADHEKIAIVDLGWSGKNMFPLEKVIKGSSEKVSKIYFYIIGNIAKRQNEYYSLENSLLCYMFSSHYNRDIHDRFCKESAAGFEIVEKLFNAPHNSFMGFDKNGNMQFCPLETDNYKAFEEIQAGIWDFCEKYHNAFKKYTLFSNIPGYDAYIPLRMLFNNKNAAIKLIGHMSYNKGLSPQDRYSMSGVLGGKK